MKNWNDALYTPARATRTCASTTGRRWSRTSWFIPDGIHYYSPGYAARAHLIADALAEAFPRSARRRAAASCTPSRYRYVCSGFIDDPAGTRTPGERAKASTLD